MSTSKESAANSLDLTDMIKSWLSRNTSPDPRLIGARVPARYGVAALLHQDRVLLTLTLLRDHTYCCPESICHLDSWNAERWRALRDIINVYGHSPTTCLFVDLTVVVQAGALCFDFFRPIPGHAGEYELAPQTAQAYTQRFSEADG